MTSPRAPLTFAGAMTKVAGLIGWPACCAITGRKERTLRYWSEDSCDTAPTMLQALKLDAAYRGAGGDDSPFLDALAFQLDITVERQDACTRALIADIATVAQEWGDTVAAALTLTSSNASPLDAHRAFAEAQQAARAIDALMHRLASFLPAGAGPAAGNTGGSHQ